MVCKRIRSKRIEFFLTNAYARLRDSYADSLPRLDSARSCLVINNVARLSPAIPPVSIRLGARSSCVGITAIRSARLSTVAEINKGAPKF